MEKTAFGAGCFWGIEATFRRVRGVLNVTVGYEGGDMENPTYQMVCSGTTGHAEVVLVEFDPGLVSYGELLAVFWKCHDPTTLNRQGPDHGTQYRSVIFFHSPEQEKAAIASKNALQISGAFGGQGIVTEILPARRFYRAEEYHQRYLEKHGIGNCHM